MNALNNIQDLLRQKSDFESRLKVIPYQGTPEIKESNGGRYIYLRKREYGRLSSNYIDKYSEELYAFVVNSCKNAKEINKQIRKIDKELATLGYSTEELSSRVLQNLDFARANMKSNIYDQAILEGVATTYSQTETIIDNGIVSGMTPSDIQKVLNLKHAWEFIINKDLITVNSDFYILSYIAKLVNEGIYEFGGNVRGVPVKIGGSSYFPPLPIESVVKEELDDILSKDMENIDKAIELCLYCMKRQVFIDGNKRAAVIYANHYLISKGDGVIVIPADKVNEFKLLLIEYYEDKNTIKIKEFMKNKCWKKF